MKTHFLLAFSTYLCLAAFGQKGFAQQLLPQNHYKYQQVWKVCQQIARIRDTQRPLPELRMYAKQSKLQVTAQFVGGNPNLIYVDEKLYDLCTKFGKDSTDALACVVGHELAHYSQNHQITDGFYAGLMFGFSGRIFKTNSVEQKIRIEAEADYFGLLQAYLAGYNAYEILPKVLEKIYEEYKLPEHLKGYPSKKERIGAAEKTANEIRQLIPVFVAGRVLLLSRNYAEAALCFEHIATKFCNSKFRLFFFDYDSFFSAPLIMCPYLLYSTH